MSINIKNKLDPIFETIILLNQGFECDKLKEMIVLLLNELGGNGEVIFHKYLKEYEKYVQVFQKNRISLDGEEFYFKDTSIEFFMSFISLFLIQNDFIHTVDTMTNQQIIRVIYEHSEDLFDITLPAYSDEAHEDFMKIENLISMINSTQLNENEKWKMLLVLQNPKEYYSRFAKMIIRNIPAYEKAYTAIESTIHKYIKLYVKQFSDGKYENTLGIGEKLRESDVHDITPTMALATGELIGVNGCYYGLLIDKIYSEIRQKGKSKDFLLGCLRALSDNSKLEILITLKSCPKYATELAEQLGITTATVSHHMNTLFTYQMVYLEKENGKAYYHLNTQTLTDIINQLNLLLL